MGSAFLAGDLPSRGRRPRGEEKAARMPAGWLWVILATTLAEKLWRPSLPMSNRCQNRCYGAGCRVIARNIVGGAENAERAAVSRPLIIYGPRAVAVRMPPPLLPGARSC